MHYIKGSPPKAALQKKACVGLCLFKKILQKILIGPMLFLENMKPLQQWVGNGNGFLS